MSYYNGKYNNYNNNNTSHNSGEQKKEDVGAIWVRQAANGLDYFSIIINGEQYIAFQNKYKKEAKHPDFQIYKAKNSGTSKATTPIPEPKKSYGGYNGYNSYNKANANVIAEEKAEEEYYKNMAANSRIEETTEAIEDIPDYSNYGMPML